MITICRYTRLFTTFLCLLYIFTGSGLDKVAYQCVSLIHSSVVFPCKGKGCQCDKAGYELSNCQCDHENNISCCSVEEPSFKQESCCSEDTGCNDTFISNLPCQGVEESDLDFLAKHLLFLPQFNESTSTYTKSPKTPYEASMIEAELQSLGKVPIFS